MNSKMVTFYTDHFSMYIINAPVAINTSVTNPKTGEDLHVKFAIFALISSATAVVLMKRKRCK